MHKYEQNLWKLLSKPPPNFGLRKRMDLATKVVDEMVEYSKKRLVHRDLKLSNIMMNFHGDSIREIVIVDFGIAKQKLQGKV